MTTSCVPVEITEKKLTSFMARLKHLIDTRDNRGKRHELVYVLGSVVLAIMSGRSYASSIQRFIKNRIEWLRRILNNPEAKPVSRAQLFTLKPIKVSPSKGFASILITRMHP